MYNILLTQSVSRGYDMTKQKESELEGGDNGITRTKRAKRVYICNAVSTLGAMHSCEGIKQQLGMWVLCVKCGSWGSLLCVRNQRLHCTNQTEKEGKENQT